MLEFAQVAGPSWRVELLTLLLADFFSFVVVVKVEASAS